MISSYDVELNEGGVKAYLYLTRMIESNEVVCDQELSSNNSHNSKISVSLDQSSAQHGYGSQPRANCTRRSKIPEYLNDYVSN